MLDGTFVINIFSSEFVKIIHSFLRTTLMSTQLNFRLLSRGWNVVTVTNETRTPSTRWSSRPTRTCVVFSQRRRSTKKSCRRLKKSWKAVFRASSYNVSTLISRTSHKRSYVTRKYIGSIVTAFTQDILLIPDLLVYILCFFFIFCVRFLFQ